MAIKVNNTTVIDNSRNLTAIVDAKSQRYLETHVSYSGTAITVNTSAGNSFTASITGNATFTFSNPPSDGSTYGFILKVSSSGAFTITWPASVDWGDATAPEAPAASTVSIYAFFTNDNGVTWYGFEGGKAMG